MAITQVNVGTPSNLTVFTDTAMGNTADGVKASSAQVYTVTVNNTANATPVYVKLYNLAVGSVIVGTTVPDQVIYVLALQVQQENYFTMALGFKMFGTALTAACVTTGGTAGTTSPASAVTVSIVYQ